MVHGLIPLLSALSQGESDTSQNEQVLDQSGARQYTLFQGHAGPVYAASFSPVGDFILSSSADSTSRFIWTVLHFCYLSLLCFLAIFDSGLQFIHGFCS